MNVSLTPEFEDLINQKVASGMYHSASEVVREALRLLKEQDEFRQLRHEQLRKDIQIGIDQAERGEFSTLSIDEIKAKARQLYESRQQPG